jgi:hypothetical protein
VGRNEATSLDPELSRLRALETAIQQAQSNADNHRKCYYVYYQGNTYNVAPEDRSWFGRFVCKCSPRGTTTIDTFTVREPARV